MIRPGNTKGVSITVPLTSCLTGLDLSVLQIKTKNVSGHKADSKPVKQVVNGTVILPPLVFLDQTVVKRTVVSNKVISVKLGKFLMEQHTLLSSNKSLQMAALQSGTKN
jgi:hypothetical protein